MGGVTCVWATLFSFFFFYSERPKSSKARGKCQSLWRYQSSEKMAESLHGGIRSVARAVLPEVRLPSVPVAGPRSGCRWHLPGSMEGPGGLEKLQDRYQHPRLGRR